MFVIDGMDGIEAGYHFAGIVGIHPRHLTLRQLWMMSNGVVVNRRREILEQACLVWSLGSIDYADYLHFGEMTETGAGEPVQLTPELQSRVDEEVERIRRENPSLPGFRPQS